MFDNFATVYKDPSTKKDVTEVIYLFINLKSSNTIENNFMTVFLKTTYVSAGPCISTLQYFLLILYSWNNWKPNVTFNLVPWCGKLRNLKQVNPRTFEYSGFQFVRDNPRKCTCQVSKTKFNLDCKHPQLDMHLFITFLHHKIS